MEIKPPSLTPTQINQLTRVVAAQGSNDGASTIPPAWQVGRLVQALVMKITGNMLYLDIQGTKVHAPKPQNLAISTGQSLLLNITSRTPSVQFNIISAQPTVKEISQQVNQPVLPQVKQSTLESFFKDISFIANRPALRPVPLPPVVNQEIRQLYKLLPAPHQLKTPAQVKSFIQNSGIFLENKLASAILAPISTKNSSSTKPQVNNDLRGQLLRLAEIIKNQLPAEVKNSLLLAPNQTQQEQTTKSVPTIMAEQNKPVPDSHKTSSTPVKDTNIHTGTVSSADKTEELLLSLLKHTDTSTARIQQNQLQSHSGESQVNRNVWVTELPIKNGTEIDIFKLKIEEEKHNTNDTAEENKTWHVRLEFDLHGLGSVTAHVSLHNEAISARFTTENSSTLKLFNHYLDVLKGRLRYNGLNLAEIKCEQQLNSASTGYDYD